MSAHDHRHPPQFNVFLVMLLPYPAKRWLSLFLCNVGIHEHGSPYDTQNYAHQPTWRCGRCGTIGY